MSGMVGRDIAGVRHLSRLMLTKADEIDDAARQITAQLNSVKWVGNDAQRFRNDWNGRHTATLRYVCDELRTAGKQEAKDADEQEKAFA
ncbi:hypothetical protein [Propioniciclava sp.]|uniref:hypothetical protein n=1 Tax=Propioniciclava sp. TaxID=2038686 RepID=UPI00261C27E9|nr:hypothetical protein [Propioniciclava sp.]